VYLPGSGELTQEPKGQKRVCTGALLTLSAPGWRAPSAQCRPAGASGPGLEILHFGNRLGHSNARVQRDRSIGGRRRLWDCGENRRSRCGVDFIELRVRPLRSRESPARAVILTAVQEPLAFMERCHLVIAEGSFCERRQALQKCRNSGPGPAAQESATVGVFSIPRLDGEAPWPGPTRAGGGGESEPS
jgi:hypothetical protein